MIMSVCALPDRNPTDTSGISTLEMTTAFEIYPTWTPPGSVYDLQVADLHKLHQLSRQRLAGRHEMGELMSARDTAKSLSRHDMARATGLSETQVERIIAEHRDRHKIAPHRTGGSA